MKHLQLAVAIFLFTIITWVGAGQAVAQVLCNPPNDSAVQMVCKKLNEQLQQLQWQEQQQQLRNQLTQGYIFQQLQQIRQQQEQIQKEYAYANNCKGLYHRDLVECQTKHLFDSGPVNSQLADQQRQIDAIRSLQGQQWMNQQKTQMDQFIQSQQHERSIMPQNYIDPRNGRMQTLIPLNPR